MTNIELIKELLKTVENRGVLPVYRRSNTQRL